MSLRARLTAMSSLIVGVILALGTVSCYVVVRNGLLHQTDDQLRLQGQFLRSITLERGALPDEIPALPRDLLQGGTPYVQVIRADGSVVRPSTGGPRVTATDRAVARGEQGAALATRDGDGERTRVLTLPLGDLGAVQVGRSLATVDQALSTLRLVLGLLIVVGIALAALAGRLSYRRVLAPIGRLAQAMARVRSTGDLGLRVHESRTDEVGELARRFDAMLDELERARDDLAQASVSQRQLVADASHELRTPITALRTNVEVLLARDGDPLTAPLLRDVLEQAEELSTVVADLIELARGDAQPAERYDLDLRDVVQGGVARSRLHAPSLVHVCDLAPWPMVGDAERLGRAVNNVLDNATKFSPPGAVVSVRLAEGELVVRDTGPGVPEAELPHLFDRFFRGRDAHAKPGSGLGLAIVRQVVESHGGSVGARSAPDGGLEVVLRLPGE